jgi:hypothetical protein
MFSGPCVARSPTLNMVTLSTGLAANQLSLMRSGYVLTGGDLTFAAPRLGFMRTLASA